MAFPDGSKRDPSKSKLFHEILLNIPDNSPTELGIDKTKCACYQLLPKGYARYDNHS